MTALDKAAQRSSLLLQMGDVFRTVREIVEKPSPPTRAEYRVAAAIFRHDIDRWLGEVSAFVTVGQYRFEHESTSIRRSLNRLHGFVGEISNDDSVDDVGRQTRLREKHQLHQRAIVAAIDRVPIEWTPKLHGAKTPFALYLHIRDAISTAKERIHYFDRYLDVDFYHLYVRELSRSLEIRLLTTAGKPDKSGQTGFGIAQVQTLSRLVGGEFSDYELRECTPSDLHDRNLRVDDAVFFLGTGTGDAGEKPTNFGPGDCTANGHAILDSIIAKGVLRH